MTLARAVIVTRPGGIEVLDVIERDVREPGPSEVRIAVRAAAVNPADILMRENGSRGEPPWIPGMDAAGLIESVGAEVDRLAVGDCVMAALRPIMPDGGALAELVVVPADAVVPVPAGATLEQAATLPMNGVTALHGLELLGLRAGETLGVSGAAGLVSSYVIPLAKRRGLHVIADAAPQDEELVRGFGAHVVLPRGDDYPEAIRRQIPRGVDGFFDNAVLMRPALRAVRDGGGLAAVRRWDCGEPERGIHVHDVAVGSQLGRTGWLNELRELASRGVLSLRVAGTYAPEQIGEAHRVTGSGGIRGRAVIVFGAISG